MRLSIDDGSIVDSRDLVPDLPLGSSLHLWPRPVSEVGHHPSPIVSLVLRVGPERRRTITGVLGGEFEFDIR